MSSEFANLNELWSRAIVETMKAKGLRYAVICPGSRSSPLAFAFARAHGIEAISVLDERSAGFFALGIAKRECVPVALVCTSGTAAANFFPAIVEASESGLPLVVITADRPHELRLCRAGQTIDQVKLYGSYPVSQVELALPESTIPMLRYLRQTIASLMNQSMAPRLGPVHINAPFRDPLAPVSDEKFESPFSEDEWKRFFSRLEPSRSCVMGTKLDLSEFTDCDRGIIIVGSPLIGTNDQWIENVAQFAEALKWPVLADGLSPLRSHARKFPRLVTGYNAICRADLSGTHLLPERAIVIGDLPISKTLRAWLKALDIEVLFLAPFFQDFDSNRGLSETKYFDFNEGIPQVRTGVRKGFADLWMIAEKQVNEKLAEMRVEQETIFEGRVASVLSREIQEGSALFVSNSMPPRDLDCFWEANSREVEIYSSRGANGIDGILSTALGIAHRGKPAYLLTGDLALLHDSNGGLISKNLVGSLDIVLINNSGGGIFEMLPVAQFGDEFEAFFATDQKVDFSKWAATYNIEYRKARDVADLADFLGQRNRTGVRMIEVVTNRKRDAAFRKQIFAEIADSLDLS